MSNPTDLRVIKTRQAIRIALISLLSEKELSDITISELSARAQVNRKTFYRHYRSISDVVTEFENELLSDFSDILKTSNTSIFNIGSVLGEISALISSNQEYFVKLLKLNPELFSTRQGYAPARYRDSPARRVRRERRADTACAVGIHGKRRSVAVFGVV